jgi:hypothetical protein
VFQQKKLYKVCTPIEKRNGGMYWLRLGTGVPNKDGVSLNVYLDAMPKNHQLTLFELDEEDLRKRDSSGSSNGSSSGSSTGFGSGNGSARPPSLNAGSQNDIPF